MRAALAEMRPALDADAGWSEITAASLDDPAPQSRRYHAGLPALRLAIADDRDPEQLTLVFTLDALGTPLCIAIAGLRSGRPRQRRSPC